MGNCLVLMMGSGSGLSFDSISIRRFKLSLLVVHWIEGLEVIVKSLATFGDIGDSVESPGCMTAVGGVVVYRGH